jgi:hypothetical protein
MSLLVPHRSALFFPFLFPDGDYRPTSASRSGDQLNPLTRLAETDRLGEREQRKTLPNPCGHRSRPLPPPVEGQAGRLYPDAEPLDDLMLFGYE